MFPPACGVCNTPGAVLRGGSGSAASDPGETSLEQPVAVGMATVGGANSGRRLPCFAAQCRSWRSLTSTSSRRYSTTDLEQTNEAGPAAIGGGPLKSSLLASTALCAILAPSAFAADLPTKKGPPHKPAPVAAPFSWTGFYLGAQRRRPVVARYVETLNGFDFWSARIRDTLFYRASLAACRPATITSSKASLSASRATSIGRAPVAVRTGVFGDFGRPTHSASLPFFADLRGRVGFAFDRFLPYVTGGVVFAN